MSYRPQTRGLRLSTVQMARMDDDDRMDDLLDEREAARERAHHVAHNTGPYPEAR